MNRTPSRDDSKTMKVEDVERVVMSLCVSYSLLRRSFLTRISCIEKLLSTNRINDVIREMRVVFRLPSHFITRVGYAAKMSSPAMLQMEFRKSMQAPVAGTLYFQKSRQELAGLEQYMVIHMIAHEFSHARLYLDKHPLRVSEFATDVLALLVAGDAERFSNTMSVTRKVWNICYVTEEYGYIRPELRHEVYRCLGQYSESIYL